MQFAEGQLSALAAVLREGSFDRAARVLHVTASAVSQRIKQLEERVGTILVVRGSPCTATATGEALYRHALQVELLERDLLGTLGPGGPGHAVAASLMRIAVNADSLATWLVPALASFTARTGTRIEVALDDQEHTADWLRSGRVLGAVTSDSRPVQGCRVHPLGTMRYLATASPRFMKTWFPDGPTADALRCAPALAYNRKDEATERFIRDVIGLDVQDLPSSYLPSPHAYLDANLRGLGWGMNPEPLVIASIKRKRLVELFVGRALDVALYWQQWALASPTLDALASAIATQARTVLRTGTRPERWAAADEALAAR